MHFTTCCMKWLSVTVNLIAVANKTSTLLDKSMSDRPKSPIMSRREENRPKKVLLFQNYNKFWLCWTSQTLLNSSPSFQEWRLKTKNTNWPIPSVVLFKSSYTILARASFQGQNWWTRWNSLSKFTLETWRQWTFWTRCAYRWEQSVKN